MSTIVFDVNETLSDMSPIADRFEQLGMPGELAQTWFAATLRDGFALAVHGTSRPFAEVGRYILQGMFATRRERLTTTPDEAADAVLNVFGSLALHPDVTPCVAALKRAGHRLTTLSNGAVSIAEGLLERAGLRSEFDHLLSADNAGVWKPHPHSYLYAAATTDSPVNDLVLVAVHPWDLDGAHRAGLATAFLDRTGAPWPAMFAAPDHHVRTLAELADRLPETQVPDA